MKQISVLARQEISKAMPGAIVGGQLNLAQSTGIVPLANLPAHASTHETGGSDALTTLLDANARVAVALGDGAAVSTRRQLDFEAGSNVTVTVTDDSSNERAKVNISAAGLSGLLDAEGDLLYQHSSSPSRLGIGTAGEVLTVVGGDPAWQAPVVWQVLMDGTDGTLVLTTANDCLMAPD